MNKINFTENDDGTFKIRRVNIRNVIGYIEYNEYEKQYKVLITSDLYKNIELCEKILEELYITLSQLNAGEGIDCIKR